MRLLLIGLILLSSGCGLFQKPKPPVITYIPVVNPCLTSRPVTPVMQFDLLPKSTDEKEAAQHAKVLWDDRQALLNLVVEWQTAASGCQVVK